MVNFWEGVNKVIRQADILLLCLDARFVQETRNDEIEEKVQRAEKPIIYVLTKSDLGSKGALLRKSKDLKPSVLFSSKARYGTHNLEMEILKIAKEKKMESIKVGVLGYPNVGKSSLINSMKGKSSLKVSPLSGYTKRVTRVNARGISFMDTPGVIPYKENDEKKHVLISAIDYTKYKDPDLAVFGLMEHYMAAITRHYGVIGTDKEKVIEDIAKKNNFLLKGNVPDIARAARMILREWQTGKIKTR